ncbi:hypothetical protein JCM11641_002870 [Rhodosporidiobolus odoratus]
MPPIAQLLLSLLPLTTSTHFPPHDPNLRDEIVAPLRGLQSQVELDAWAAQIREKALDKVFANIGRDPDYFFTWTRDAALTASGLLSLLPLLPSNTSPAIAAASSQPDTRSYISHDSTNRTLSFFSDYVDGQLVLQKLSNPSGTYETLEGLGEPKFHPNLTAYLGDWGRPQRDGPALRASAVMQYIDYMTSAGPLDPAFGDKAIQLVRADLDYTAKYWNHTTFDLWEEVKGSSFFTTIAQFHALRHGAAFFASIDARRSQEYKEEAKKALCFAQEYLEDGEAGKWVRSNINIENGVKRNDLDANSMLATLLSPPSSICASHLFTPCSAHSLTNLASVIRSFTSLYPINHDGETSLVASIPLPREQTQPQMTFSTSFSRPLRPIAVGRYSEDTYYGGNPWYLTTLAAAEQLYRASTIWKREGRVQVSGDGAFWERVVGLPVGAGVYESGTDDIYEEMLEKVRDFADGMLDVVRQYIPQTGQVDEQIDKVTGAGRSARDLTWSYIALLTTLRARSDSLAASWLSPRSARAATSDETWLHELECPPPSDYNGTMSVGFELEVETKWGETVFLAGSSPSLGSWDVSRAIRLSARDYTSPKPLWKTKKAVEIEGRRGIEWKIVKLQADGSVVWEAGENRVFYTSSSGSRTIATRWRGA